MHETIQMQTLDVLEALHRTGRDQEMLGLMVQLPVSIYTDPDVLDREMATVFSHYPMVAGHVASVREPGLPAERLAEAPLCDHAWNRWPPTRLPQYLPPSRGTDRVGQGSLPESLNLPVPRVVLWAGWQAQGHHQGLQLSGPGPLAVLPSRTASGGAGERALEKRFNYTNDAFFDQEHFAVAEDDGHPHDAPLS